MFTLITRGINYETYRSFSNHLSAAEYIYAKIRIKKKFKVFYGELIKTNIYEHSPKVQFEIVIYKLKPDSGYFSDITFDIKENIIPLEVEDIYKDSRIKKAIPRIIEQEISEYTFEYFPSEDILVVTHKLDNSYKKIQVYRPVSSKKLPIQDQVYLDLFELIKDKKKITWDWKQLKSYLEK